jgi:hypothetical protein
MLGRLLVTACVMGGLCAGAIAQGAFPAPLPNQSGGVSPFPAPPNPSGDATPSPAPSPLRSSPDDFQKAAPPVGGFPSGQGAEGTAEHKECMAKFAPLRQDAEHRARLIKAASERKTSAKEACDLITSYIAAEKLVVDFVTTRQAACNISNEILKQLKANQSRSEQMMKMICKAAKDQPPPHQPYQPPTEWPRRFDMPPLGQPRFGILHINTPPGR